MYEVCHSRFAVESLFLFNQSTFSYQDFVFTSFLVSGLSGWWRIPSQGTEYLAGVALSSLGLNEPIL